MSVVIVCGGRRERSWGRKLECKWQGLVVCRRGRVPKVLSRLGRMV